MVEAMLLQENRNFVEEFIISTWEATEKFIEVLYLILDAMLNALFEFINEEPLLFIFVVLSLSFLYSVYKALFRYTEGDEKPKDLSWSSDFAEAISNLEDENLTLCPNCYEKQPNNSIFCFNCIHLAPIYRNIINNNLVYLFF